MYHGCEVDISWRNVFDLYPHPIAEKDGAKGPRGIDTNIIIECSTSQSIAIRLYPHVFDAGCLILTLVCTLSCDRRLVDFTIPYRMSL